MIKEMMCSSFARAHAINTTLNKYWKIPKTGVEIMTFLITILTLFAFSSPFISIQEDQAELIHTYHHDVTGDGETNEIKLYGVPFDETALYYEQIWAIVSL